MTRKPERCHGHDGSHPPASMRVEGTSRLLASGELRVWWRCPHCDDTRTVDEPFAEPGGQLGFDV